MLIGGISPDNSFSAKTFYFDHILQTWTPGPTLQQGRWSHTADLVFDSVTKQGSIIVAGGYSGYILDSTEILHTDSLQWEKGTMYIV